jgi:hypothetical protein
MHLAASSHRRRAGAPERAERVGGLPAQHELVVHRRNERPDQRANPEYPLRIPYTWTINFLRKTRYFE